MNKLTIIGNLARDPELRSVNTANGPVNVCDFTVAVNSTRGRRNQQGSQQDEAQFFRCTAWRGLADVIHNYARKGGRVCVMGPVTARTYTAGNGETRVSLEVTVEDFEFCSSRNESAGAAPSPAYDPAPAPTAQNQGFQSVDSDELPF